MSSAFFFPENHVEKAKQGIFYMCQDTRMLVSAYFS
jgi:hypothetical protein